MSQQGPKITHWAIAVLALVLQLAGIILVAVGHEPLCWIAQALAEGLRFTESVRCARQDRHRLTS